MEESVENFHVTVFKGSYRHRLDAKGRLPVPAAFLVQQMEWREALADACFRFLPARAALDLAGWAEPDIFAP